MGFGLLFLGYFTAYFMSLGPIPLELIGYALMIWAVIRLSEYNTRFKNCIAPLGALCVIGVYTVLCMTIRWIGLPSVICSERVEDIVLHIGEMVNVAYHVCLLIAICSLAKETELPKQAYNSMRNLLIVCVSGVLYFVVLFIPEGKVASVFGVVSIAVRLLWIILNVVLIANCYRLICPEGEEDMPVKESKIAIIRKMNAVIDKREEEAMKAAHDLKEKHISRGARNSSQKNKHSSKRKKRGKK